MASDVGWPWVNGERGGGGRVFFVELSPGLIILPPPPQAKEPLHSLETMRTRVCTTEFLSFRSSFHSMPCVMYPAPPPEVFAAPQKGDCNACLKGGRRP